MIEKVIENWLDCISERALQVAFSHMLVCEGYSVIHSTRHCEMELGKDIIALNPNKKLCAYQLKVSKKERITLSVWRKEIQPQLIDLVQGKIDHPAIPKHKHHKSYIVANAYIDESVQRSIQDFNRNKNNKGTIKYIGKGWLLKKLFLCKKICGQMKQKM